MNLDEMREALASEATKKAEKLEHRVRDLKSDLAKKNDLITAQAEDLRILYNRCFVQGHGMLCIFCDSRMREACDKMRSVGRPS